MFNRLRQPPARRTGLKVGELARRTGLSIRTLHYYDEIGLLSPAARTDSGHRLYVAEDVARLQRIRSLQQIGFSLDEVRDCLRKRDFSLRRVLEKHKERLREQMELSRRLIAKLDTLLSGLDSARVESVEEFLETMEMMTMYEKYYTPEQLKELEQRGQQVGPARIKEVEAEWPKLIGEVRSAMQQGVDPASPQMAELAKRWIGLVREFSGGNVEIERNVARMYKNEPSAAQKSGLDPAIFEYIGKAMRAAGMKPPGV